MRKQLLIFLIIFVGSSTNLIGCSTENNNNHLNTNDNTIASSAEKSKPVSESIDSAKINSSITDSRESVAVQQQDSESSIDNSVSSVKPDENVKSIIENNLVYRKEFSQENPESGQLKFDFDKDGSVDTLEYKTTFGDNENGYRVIMNCNISIGTDAMEHIYQNNVYELPGGITSFALIDSDKNDKYIEFIISEGSLPDRIYNTIYRYIDKKIVEVGQLTGEIVAYSGDGRIYYWGGNLYEEDLFNPELVLSYYDLEKNTCVKTDQIIGKTITSDREFIVYKFYDDVQDGAPMTEEDLLADAKGKMVKLIKKGDKFTVIGLDKGVKIKTEDQKEGYIGGFHMVWD